MKGSFIRVSIISILTSIILVGGYILNMHIQSSNITFANQRKEIIRIEDRINERITVKRYEFDQSETNEQLTIIQSDVKKILTKLN